MHTSTASGAPRLPDDLAALKEMDAAVTTILRCE
jgi:hypothetical protein